MPGHGHPGDGLGLLGRLVGQHGQPLPGRLQVGDQPDGSLAQVRPARDVQPDEPGDLRTAEGPAETAGDVLPERLGGQLPDVVGEAGRPVRAAEPGRGDPGGRREGGHVLLGLGRADDAAEVEHHPGHAGPFRRGTLAPERGNQSAIGHRQNGQAGNVRSRQREARHARDRPGGRRSGCHPAGSRIRPGRTRADREKPLPPGGLCSTMT